MRPQFVHSPCICSPWEKTPFFRINSLCGLVSHFSCHIILFLNYLYLCLCTRSMYSFFPPDPFSLGVSGTSGSVDDCSVQQLQHDGLQEDDSSPPSPLSLPGIGSPTEKPFSELYDNGLSFMPPSPSLTSEPGGPGVRSHSSSCNDLLEPMPLLDFAPPSPSSYLGNPGAQSFSGSWNDLFGTMPLPTSASSSSSSSSSASEPDSPDIQPSPASFDDLLGPMPSPFPFDLHPNAQFYSNSCGNYLGPMLPASLPGFQPGATLCNGLNVNIGIYQNTYSVYAGANIMAAMQMNSPLPLPSTPQGFYCNTQTYANAMCSPPPPYTPFPPTNPFQGYQQNRMPSVPENPTPNPSTFRRNNNFVPPNQDIHATQHEEVTDTTKATQSPPPLRFIQCEPVAFKDKDNDTSTIRVVNCVMTGGEDLNRKSFGKPRIKVVYIDDSGKEKALYFRTCVIKPRAVCEWDGCDEYVWTDHRSIREHLEGVHGVCWKRKTRVACRWLGCRKTISTESLFRHITSTHMHVLRASCYQCGEDYVRTDCRNRHSSRCTVQNQNQKK
ncbi:hypothetical protein AX15_001254 [Amanita polypyramis BW_CC]|nr:hypothetical protein AX15_001254 [Amanita polypyramis BW_CC]